MTASHFEIEKNKRVIVNHLKKLPGLSGVYVHGSVSKGTERPGSDSDLALLFHHDYPIPEKQLLYISGELEAVLGRPVHIGVLNGENVIFSKEVIASGKRIYCKTPYYCDTFAMHALSFYADLNVQRKEILNSYRINK